MPEVLPSVRFQADDPRPVGFVESADGAHIAAVESALREVAATVEEVTDDTEPQLSVRFASVRYMPTLPFLLYSFHILSIGADGQFEDEIEQGGEISYAIVANHALEVQREAAVLFLYDLVTRQVALRSYGEDDSADIADIDQVAAVADRKAKQEFRDAIRAGWASATRSIARDALAAGLPLRVRYETDVLPSRNDIVRRIPTLREAYNTIPIAREAVDKTVSLIGGKDPRITARGLTQADEAKIQRQVSAMNLRLWISQTTRDAQVCGNGYVVTREHPDPGLYNLRPEEVEIAGRDTFYLLRNGAREPIEGHVLHIPGIEQFESPYGISILEPVLAELRTRRIFEDATRFAEKVIAEYGADSPHGLRVKHTVPLSERALIASDARLQQLLRYPRDWVKDARDGLYFPGQELM
ncbi:MAG: hypothetical protein WBV85_13310 [Solirubrobacteraceae bacterium]